MRWIRGLMALALACAWVGHAAAFTVEAHVLQDGRYIVSGCKPGDPDPEYNECLCEGDVRYPEITGLKDGGIQARLNRSLKDLAGKEMCPGEKSNTPPDPATPDKNHMSLQVGYEVTLSSPSIAAFKLTDWGYEGGAHGNGTVIGVIADVDKGTLLSPTDIFSQGNVADVNQVIYDALVAITEDGMFRDQVESRKGAFIKDDQCQGCTLVLASDGVHVLFQTYEVAPYGEGNPDILIPAKLVTHPALVAALAKAKRTPPEKP